MNLPFSVSLHQKKISCTIFVYNETTKENWDNFSTQADALFIQNTRDEPFNDITTVTELNRRWDHIRTAIMSTTPLTIPCKQSSTEHRLTLPDVLFTVRRHISIIDRILRHLSLSKIYCQIFPMDNLIRDWESRLPAIIGQYDYKRFHIPLVYTTLIAKTFCQELFKFRLHLRGINKQKRIRTTLHK